MAIANDRGTRIFRNYVEDNAALSGYTYTPTVALTGGIVSAVAPTYTDGDAAAFSFTTGGSLRTTATLSGTVNVEAFQNSAGTAVDAFVFTDGESLAAVSDWWQAVGGYDATGDAFWALPIAIDNAAMPANAKFLPIGGEYNATPPTYTDGDAVLFQFTSDGKLMTDTNVTLTGLDYTDDSTEFTVATSKVIAMGALATTDTVDANDIGILKMSTSRELFVTQDTHDNLNLNANVQQGDSDVAIGNALYTQLTDGTNTMPTMDVVGRAGYVYVTDGTNTQPTMDAVGRAGYFYLTDGTNTAPTMDAVGRAGYQYITDGTNTMPTMDANTRAGFFQLTNGTIELDILTADSAFGATPTGLAALGIYEATPTTYTDGDAVPFHFTSDGKLMTDTNVTLEGLDYTDDSAEFTVATSKGVAIMGLATTDQVDSGDIGALKMTVHRQLATTSFDGTGTELFVGGNPGQVQVTDGTNTMPTMDVAARAGYTYVTDGTNTQPTMDAVGRAGYQYITDGTNTMPTMDAVGRAGFVQVTDGTNTMPTGDVVGRSVFTAIGNGTDTFDPVIDGAAVAGTTAGMLALGTDGSNYQVLSTDTTGRLRVDTSSNPISGYGAQAVTTGGTPVQLPSNAATEITIKAEYANLGNIYVGTDGSVSSSTGLELSAGDAITIDLSANTNEIYIDADNNGEGVRFLYN